MVYWGIIININKSIIGTSYKKLQKLPPNQKLIYGSSKHVPAYKVVLFFPKQCLDRFFFNMGWEEGLRAWKNVNYESHICTYIGFGTKVGK